MAENTLETPVVAPKRPDTMSNWRSTLGPLGTPPAAVAPVNAPAIPAALSTTPPEPKPVPAPPKPAEPKLEAKVESVESEEDKFPRDSTNWNKFKDARKKEREEFKEKVAVLEKERNDLTEKMKGLSSVTDAAEYKSLKAERDEMEKVLRTANIRDNPKFKAHFDSKTSAQVELAKRIVGNEKGEQMARLLKLEDGDWKNQQIRDFLSEFDILDQSRIGGVMNALNQIDQERQSALAVADKDYETMAAAKKEADKQAQEQSQRKTTTLIDNGIKAITDSAKGHPAYQKREGDNEWNAAVEKRVETVKHLLTGNDVTQEKIFETAVHAVAYHQVLSNLKESQAEIAGLKEQIKALTSAQPTLENNRRAGGANGEQQQTIPVKNGSRPMEVTNNWVTNMKRAQENG